MARTAGLFWIASSDQDIAKARAVLRSLKPAGVLDELGFLVRDRMLGVGYRSVIAELAAVRLNTLRNVPG